MKSFGLREVERQIMRQDAMPKLGLRTRDDLVGLRQFLNVGGPGHQRIVKELNGADLQCAEAQLTRIPGKGDLAKAFRYALSRWPSIILFLEDGHVAIDNNAPERAMRPIGIGRKNWLFAGADTGGETLARAMTLIETAKMNGLYPQAYLADVLDRIHDHKINRLDELLPWNWKAAVHPRSEVA